MGISLQCRHVALTELSSPLAPGVAGTPIRSSTCRRCHWSTAPRRQGFIHRDDQLGNRPQPGEPGITGNKLKKMMWRLDRADLGFINRTFAVNQRLVQVEQRVAQLLERLPDGCVSFPRF